MPKVSIGLPVYNGELYICDALNSLLAQTFTDFELLISDNASEDNTGAICKEYASKNSNIRYIRQNRNLGLIENFRFVLDEACGEYFIWAAADDLQEPNFISVLVKVLDDNPTFVCAMTDAKKIGNKPQMLDDLGLLDDIRIGDVKNNWPNYRKRFFRNPTSNIYLCIYGLFKTEVIKSIDLNYGNLHSILSSMEISILAQAALHGPIVSISEPLKIYRIHEASAYNQEMKVLKSKNRLLRFFSVSRTLLLISLRSNLPVYQKFVLMNTTINTLLLRLASGLSKQGLKMISKVAKYEKNK